MKSKDDRLINSEEGVEVRIAQAVRMFSGGLQLHEINDIDDANLKRGSWGSEESG